MEFTSLFELYMSMIIAGALGGFWRLVRNPFKFESRIIVREVMGGILAGVMGGGLVTLHTLSVPWVVSVSLLCGICYDEVFSCGLKIVKKLVMTILNIMRDGK